VRSQRAGLAAVGGKPAARGAGGGTGPLSAGVGCLICVWSTSRSHPSGASRRPNAEEIVAVFSARRNQSITPRILDVVRFQKAKQMGHLCPAQVKARRRSALDMMRIKDLMMRRSSSACATLLQDTRRRGLRYTSIGR
jgi:hypothetical protein